LFSSLLGEVPKLGTEGRARWEESAATAAAHRELVDHDDPTDALGPAPKPGQTEAYASWRAAWRALGRPEADRAEAEMSTGQLRVRIRAYDREQAWAPPYVANELAGTRQAADKHRQDAAVRRAEAAAAATAGDNETAAQRQREAADAAALADALDTRAGELEQADDVRARWYAHTAETRAAADRASAELAAREAAGAITADDQPAQTAEEWLAAHAAATLAEDPHREITTDHDLTDIVEAREYDQSAAVPADQLRPGEDDHTPDSQNTPERTAEPDLGGGLPAGDTIHLSDTPQDARHAEEPTTAEASTSTLRAKSNQGNSSQRTAPAAADAHAVADAEPGPAPRDIRQEAADEPDRDDGHDPDNVRVPSADETAESVRRAQRALAELRQRQAIEEQRAADEARERDDEIARWHADAPDRAAADEAHHEPDGRTADQSADSATDRDANPADERDDAAADMGPVLEVTPADDY
jgi:hypothetical protein